MTSSCTKAHACSSSSAENNRHTDGVGLLVGRFGDRAPAPVGERGPHPLAAAQHELLERGGQIGVVGADVGGVGATLGQVLPKLIGDRARQLDG